MSSLRAVIGSGSDAGRPAPPHQDRARPARRPTAVLRRPSTPPLRPHHGPNRGARSSATRVATITQSAPPWLQNWSSLWAHTPPTHPTRAVVCYLTFTLRRVQRPCRAVTCGFVWRRCGFVHQERLLSSADAAYKVLSQNQRLKPSHEAGYKNISEFIVSLHPRACHRRCALGKDKYRNQIVAFSGPNQTGYPIHSVRGKRS